MLQLDPIAVDERQAFRKLRLYQNAVLHRFATGERNHPKDRFVDVQGLLSRRGLLDEGMDAANDIAGPNAVRDDTTKRLSDLLQIRRLTAAKPGVEQAHMAGLDKRYDLSDRPAHGVMMDRGKPPQEGVRVKLPAGMTRERLATLRPNQIRKQNLYPKGFHPF